MSIDEVDEKIVRILGQDATLSNEDIAKALNVSSNTIRRRMKKLLETGAVRIVAALNPNDFGLTTSVTIALNVSPNKLKKAIESLGKCPEVRWVSSTAGRYDVIALARFGSNEELSEFLTETAAKIDGVKGIETFICLDIQKGNYVLAVVETGYGPYAWKGKKTKD